MPETESRHKTCCSMGQDQQPGGDVKAVSMKHLTDLAAKLGAEVRDNQIDAYDGDAPIGSVWCASGNHMLISVYGDAERDGEKGARAGARLDMWQQMSHGLRPCDAKAAGEECDYCDEVEG